jgi:hypothetical protein
MMGVAQEYMVTAANFGNDGALLHVFVGMPPEKADRTVDGMRLYTRAQLIDAIQRGRRFFVASKAEGEWQVEGELCVVQVTGAPYVRLDGRAVAVDDLGRLAKIRASY